MKPIAFAHWMRLSALFCLGLFISHVHAKEIITRFDADINIATDGSMIVTETIDVISEGNKIKRGIYRDFPTEYETADGSTFRVTFDVQEVTRDNHQEPWFTQAQSNGVRVYIGDKNVFIKPGRHTYTIRYRTTRQIGFYAEHHELYWNVTGTGWEFPIKHANATVHLPQTLSQSQLKMSGYTGYQGSTDSFVSYTVEGGLPTFRTTRSLEPRQGLTILLGWPKGVIQEPSDKQRWLWMLSDYRWHAASLACAALLLVYYFIAWLGVGVDPRRGVVIPQFAPPEGLSPAAMRYILSRGLDVKCLTAALLNLAVKGNLRIEQAKDDYKLVKSAEPLSDNASAGERILHEKIFKGRSSLSLDKYSATLKHAENLLGYHLLREYHKSHFVTNRSLFGLGIVISIACLIFSALAIASPEIIGIFFLSAFIVAAYTSIYKAFKRGQKWVTFIWLGVMLMLLSFFKEWIGYVHWAPLLSIALVMILNPLFFFLLEAPTKQGRKVIDKIEGFKMYLETAEGDTLSNATLPEKTPKLYETYLPYALALGVEQQWSEQFNDVFANLPKESYQPIWYSGTHLDTHRMSNFGSHLSHSFSSSIASASIPPSSSSGSSGFSGGGGSSGGGGGGGGGGGW